MELDRLYQPFQLHTAMTYKTKCRLITFQGLVECAKRLDCYEGTPMCATATMAPCEVSWDEL